MKTMIDYSLALPTGNFYDEECAKSLIVLHHTVGGSAASTARWWQDDPRHVATAYLVERDGAIYEAFPPDYWAWHLGVKNVGIEQRSIGIELASEGGLTVRRENMGPPIAYAYDGKRRLGHALKLKADGRIIHLAEEWRGFRWFDAYDPPQVAATIDLVVDLCERFHIPPRLPSLAEWRGPADLTRWLHYEGVVHHAMLRPDKSDLHPGFDYEGLQAALDSFED